MAGLPVADLLVSRFAGRALAFLRACPAAVRWRPSIASKSSSSVELAHCTFRLP